MLPVSVLSPSAETAETLSRWGVRTCAVLAGLPVLQLSERLGQEGVRLHALARGAVSRSLAIAEPGHFIRGRNGAGRSPSRNSIRFLFCWADCSISFARVWRRVRWRRPPFACDSNCSRLLKMRSIDRKEIFRKIDPPGAFERELQLPVPSRDSKMLLKLLRLRLQSNPPGAPVRKITLGAESARPRATQGGLFLPSFPDPEKLEVTIARIANVVGEGNIGSPSLVDTWRPGEFQMRRFLAPVETVGTEATDHGDACSSRQASQKLPSLHELSNVSPACARDA